MTWSRWSCESAIGLAAEPPPGFETYRGVVSLPSGVQQLGRFGPDNDPSSLRQFSKIPLMLRAGTEVDLIVGAESQSNALISLGERTSSAPASHLTSEPCSQERSEEWRVFAGGVWVLKPGCIELAIETDDEVFIAPATSPCDPSWPQPGPRPTGSS